MNIILGGTGHVGAAVADTLIQRGQPVTIVTHDPAKVDEIERRGAEAAVADVLDIDAMRAVFRRGRRAFLLNPPAAPDTDTDAQEKKTAAAIAAGVQDSGLEKIVAESTYGAHPVERAGDLGVLHDFEQALRALPPSASFIRAAYYMSNWDAALETAREDGVVHTLFPVDFKLPMAVPQDLGRAAAGLLLGPADQTEVRYVEGPQRYSSADVAAAFSRALGRPVRAVATPRDGWVDAFKTLGFSEPAARSYARMTASVLDEPLPPAEEAERGPTSLQAYIDALVARPESQAA